jgi:2-octaprenyl-6-methoxyphenol hydroxylase
MKTQKICVIGDGLAGLTTIKTLKNLNLDIDYYFSDKKINKKNSIDRRTTAISESNYTFLRNTIKLLDKNIFWPCKEMNLFYKKDQTYINFLNFKEDKKNLMYIFENQRYKNWIFKNLKNKRIKLIKGLVSEVNHEKSFIRMNKKIFYYDLIILCLGSRSSLYNNITKNRSISKDYKEISITGYVKHNSKILNPSQYFLKEGPMAVLPFKKNLFSFVWSVDKNFYELNQKNLDKIISIKLKEILDKKIIFKIVNVQSFPVFLNLSTKYFKNNVLILGEGLHSIHPIAGQGFNLVIRDVKKIYELLKENLNLGLSVKNSLILKDFYKARNAENTLFGIGVDATNSFFKHNKIFEPVKNVILNNVKNSGSIKKFSQMLANKGFD